MRPYIRRYVNEAYQCAIHLPIVLAAQALIVCVAYGIPWVAIEVTRRVL